MRISSFDASLPTGFDALVDELESRVWQLQTWVNDIAKAAEPRFLAGEKFLGALIKEIKRQLPKLNEANYFVYLDEYENLAPYQKRIVNTWLKHSEIPLIFNLAIKRNAFETQQTTGAESLANIHDYRIHDLEVEIEPAFQSFAAEILFLQLAIAGRPVPVDPAVLRDPERLNERRQRAYLDAVMAGVDGLFPGLTHEEMAKKVFESPVIAKLRERVKRALDHRNRNLQVDSFIRPGLPQASVVTPALLYRRNLEPDQIISEMDKLERGEGNDFLIGRQWIHNNFIGSYLQLFEPHSRPCPFYAGFGAFCQLSRENLRHFLELCHQSISRVDGWEGESAVPIDIQADAARAASTAFLREVRSCGPYGEQLYTFVLRLGSLFAISHQRPTQSEPEQTHFSIGDSTVPMDDRDFAFLREAVKWSILYEEEETKQKDAAEPEDVEYILDPIYAPYFHISYRKRRKIKLATDELITLIRGNYESVKGLLRRFSHSWGVDTGDLTPTLFSHLGQDK